MVPNGDLAKQIAANSPLGVQASKASLVFSRDHSVADGLEHLKLMNQVYLQAPDIPQAVQASRPPRASPHGGHEGIVMSMLYL